MANNVIRARTADRDADGKTAIPMDLAIAISDDGQLESIVATDREGRDYVVSIKLQRAGTGLCCCIGPSGRVYCYYTDHCDCGPV